MLDFLGQIAANPGPIALGATLGVALTSAFYGVREWPRWRYRRQRQRRIASGDLTALSEPEETEEYLPHSLTEEERRNLPWGILGGAAVGTTTAIFLTIDHPISEFLVAISGVMIGLAGLIFARSDERADSQLDPDELTKRKWERLKDIGFFIGWAAFMSLLALGLPKPVSDWLGSFGLTPRDWFNGFWVMAMIVLAALWLRRFQSGPPDFLDDVDEETWNRETAIMLIAAITIGFMAMLVVFA